MSSHGNRQSKDRSRTSEHASVAKPKRKRLRKESASSSSLKKPADTNNTAKANEQNVEPLPFGACVQVSQRFSKVGRIGEGTYGIVYKAEDKLAPGNYVALKRCLPHHQATDGFPVTTLREIQSLRLLHHHPNIISLRLDMMVAVSKQDTFLVFDYCEHDLAQLLDADHKKKQQPAKMGLYKKSSYPKSPFREAHVKTLIKHLLSALQCIHEHRLIHRDIKVSNLLYTETGLLKLADFGLSRPLPGSSKADQDDGGYQMTPNVVSLWYRPPELLLGSPTYTQAIDVWGAGCVFAELLQGYPLWCCSNEMDQIQSIFGSLGVPTVEAWPRLMQMPKVQNGTVSLAANGSNHKGGSKQVLLLDQFSYLSTSGLMLLSHLLHYDASKQRLSAAKALESSYFTSEPLPTPPSQMPKFRSLHTPNTTTSTSKSRDKK